MTDTFFFMLYVGGMAGAWHLKRGFFGMFMWPFECGVAMMKWTNDKLREPDVDAENHPRQETSD
ncbi:MAG: hypothetical protein FJX25_02440 [Alphaproteobacteria bacterium]|nr:hypothetical protein [Alphaproteobacteria bacterium]